MIRDRIWYVTLLAANYLVFFTAASLAYLWEYMLGRSVDASIAEQLLAAALAVSALLYFYLPATGHLGLLLATVAALVVFGRHGPHVGLLHGGVLLVLLMPLIDDVLAPRPRIEDV